MTQGEEVQTSFYNAEPKDLGSAVRLDESQVVDKSSNQESWCVAWSPNNQFVAWSQGGGIVYLLPWDSKTGRVLKKPARNLNCYLQRLTQDPAYIDNLPRRTEPDQNDEQEEMQWNDENDDRVSSNKQETKCFRIDCMDYVWSMAFGNGVSNSQINVHRRFTFRSDLILATGLQGGKIKLWNVYTGNLLMELLDHKKIVNDLSFLRDGSLKLASCSSDCTIKLWDLNSDGNMYKTLRFKENVMVFSIKWSPSGKHLATVGMNKCAYIWDTDTFSFPRKLVGHHHNVKSCDFSPDGALLATASYDTRVILWDPYTGDQIKILGHLFPSPRPIYAGGANEHYVRKVSFSRDGHMIATVADDSYLRFWSLDSEFENPDCIAESPKVLCCAFSSNSHTVATGRRDGVIEFFQPKTSKVAKLQHLCRLKIRQEVMETKNVDLLQYPLRLKEYLKYKLL